MQYLLTACLFFFTFLSNAQYQTQLELSKNFTDGNYIVYRNDLGKIDKIAKQWPINIVRNGDVIEKIVVKRAGVVEEEYMPDLKESPGYFMGDNYRLIFLQDIILCYKQSGNGYNASDFDLAFEFTLDANAKTLKVEEAKQYLANYRNATLAHQSTARETIAKNKEANEAKEREANSLKGKNVKSLAFKAVEIPEKFTHYSKLQFGIIATLQDGTELKTKNLGGKTDFEESYDISVPGCIYVDGKIEVGTDASFFTNDEISVIIKNLHNPNQQLIHKIPIPYNLPIEIFMNGKNGNSGTSGNSGNRNCSNGSAGQAGYNGEDGSDCTIKIIETKHKITGATLYAAEITRMRDKKIFKLKWDASSPITINNSGGKGGEGGRGGYLASGCKNGIARGGSGGPGGTGGRGGNVNITMSSVNIPKSAIVINNNGGKGGIPGEGKDGGSTGISGKDGIDGKIEINTSAVKLSW
jgi:hypothetical protein